MLKTMKEKFVKNLQSAQKAEIESEIGYQRLRSTKEGELRAATQAVEEKTANLAQTKEKVAKDKEDLENTRAQLSADQVFLVDLQKRGAIADKDYAARLTMRQGEEQAIAE